VRGDNCKSALTIHGDTKHYSLLPHATPPKEIEIELTPNLETDPILIRAPYPAEGVFAFDVNDKKLKTDLTIQELIGSQVHLYSNKDFAEIFEIEIALLPITSRSPKYIFKIPVKNRSEIISLYSYKPQIIELLSLSDDLDASVRLKIGNKKAFSCNIKRFAELVQIDRQNNLIFFTTSLVAKHYLQKPIAIRIAEPEQKPIKLESKNFNGLELNHFQIPRKIETGGPWMIVPSKDAEIEFRPNFFMNEDFTGNSVSLLEAQSIQAAVKTYHPRQNPHVIDTYLNAMTEDFNHKGWGYIKTMWKEFGYLPFSTFAIWKALVINKKALTMSLFIMDMDSTFIQKLNIEFPILWEAIQLDVWAETVCHYKGFLLKIGLDDAFAETQTLSQFENFNQATGAIPDEVIQYLVKGTKLKVYPGLIVEAWFAQMLVDHSDSKWPSLLTNIMQKLSEEVTSLDFELPLPNMLRHQIPVALYPVLCAAISTGIINESAYNFNSPEFNFECKALRTFEPDWFTGMYCYCIAIFTKAQGQ
jgi:hypothetical protein